MRLYMNCEIYIHIYIYKVLLRIFVSISINLYPWIFILMKNYTCACRWNAVQNRAMEQSPELALALMVSRRSVRGRKNNRKKSLTEEPGTGRLR